jgi:hypothetical protein
MKKIEYYCFRVTFIFTSLPKSLTPKAIHFVRTVFVFAAMFLTINQHYFPELHLSTVMYNENTLLCEAPNGLYVN